MPALCRPVHEGGTGFDYRLAMGLPDQWVRCQSCAAACRLHVGALLCHVLLWGMEQTGQCAR